MQIAHHLSELWKKQKGILFMKHHVLIGALCIVFSVLFVSTGDVFAISALLQTWADWVLGLFLQHYHIR